MQIGQDGAARFEAFDPAERVRERKVTRMRRVAQRVDDPDVEIGQGVEADIRDRTEVDRIGEIAETKAERSDVAMLLQDRQGGEWPSLPLDRNRPTGNEPVLG